MTAKIGSLRADLTLETGRFRAGAADAQARMAALKLDFKASSREIRAAANDMGLGVQGFSRQLADLRARFDPLSAAQAQYRKEIDLARKAFDLGAISGKMYGQAVVEAGQKLARFRVDLGSINDNGSTKQLSAEMAALKARLDPAGAALSAYRAEASLLRQAHREGVISTQQFVAGMRAATATYRQAQDGVTAANGAARAGMAQLQFQINDVATMWAMGAKPMQIFASQAGQVVQAISLMTNGAGKFGAFMAGPWGLAITSGIIVLASLAPMLLKTKDAMKDVEMASNGLTDAQSALGDMFDLTTGKLKSQNEMLRLNAQLMAINLRAQASQARDSSASTFRNFETGNLGLSVGQKALGALGFSVGGAMERDDAVRRLLSDYRTGAVTSIEASKRAEALNFDGLAVSKQEFLQAVADGVSAPLKDKTAAAIEKSLADGVLDPSLRRDPTGKPKKPKKPEITTDAEQAEQLGRYDVEILRARLDLATSAEERSDLEGQMLDLEKAQRYAEIDSNKKLDAAQKEQQRKKLEAIYGAPANDNGDIVVRQGLAYRIQQRRDEQAQARLAADMLARQGESLQALAAIAPNARERARLEAEALDLQQEIARNLLDQQIASGDIADADRARALLAQRQQAEQRRLQIQNMGPRERYLYDLRASVSDINTSIEGIEVDGIQGLTDGLANAIAGTEKLGDVFSNVAKRIVADLARIMIQRAIVGTLGNVLGGALGIASGGGGSSLPFDVSSMADNSFSAMPTISLAGARANGGPVRARLPYLVGERGPEVVIPDAAGQVIPNHELSGLGGGGDNYEINMPMHFTGAMDLATKSEALRFADAARQAAISGMMEAQRRRG